MPEERPGLPAPTADLIREYYQAWTGIQEWMQRLTADPRGEAKRSRLLAQQRAIERDMLRLDAQTAGWLRFQTSKDYADGALAAAQDIKRGPFTWNQAHEDAVRLLTDRTYRNLLDATRTVNESTARMIREIGRSRAIDAALRGETAQAASREMKRLIERNGVYAVTYSNGAQHGLASYSEMAMRTLTGNAYNEGTIRTSVERGVNWFEVFDGSDCGFESHDSGRKAHGLVVTYQESLAYPLAHPNCRRAFGPRPDIDRPAEKPAKKPDPKSATTQDDEAMSWLWKKPTDAPAVKVATAKPVAATKPVRRVAAPPRPAPKPKPAPLPARPRLEMKPPPAGMLSDDVAAVAEAKAHAARVNEVTDPRVNTALMRQAEIVPHSMKRLTGMINFTEADYKNFGGSAAMHLHQNGKSIIRLRRELFDREHQVAADHSIDSGFFARCPHGHGVENTVAHEYGHHVDSLVGFMSNAQRRSLFNKLADELGLPRVEKGDNLATEWVHKHRRELSKQVSEYGATNDRELLAEIWSEYTTSGDDARPHIKAVGDRLRKLGEKGALKP